MSQSAYDKFARTLKEVGDGGYRFDPTGSNVNVDKSNDSFNVFDLKQQPDGMPVRHTLIDMVDSLMNGRYAVLEYQGKGDNRQVDNWRNIILDRSVDAAAKAGLDMPAHDDPKMTRAFKLAGREGQWPDVRLRMGGVLYDSILEAIRSGQSPTVVKLMESFARNYPEEMAEAKQYIMNNAGSRRQFALKELEDRGVNEFTLKDYIEVLKKEFGATDDDGRRMRNDLSAMVRQGKIKLPDGGLVKVIKDPAKSGRGNIYKIERVSSPVENDTGKNLDSIRAFMEEASSPVGKDVFLTHEDMNRVIADGLPNEIRENRDMAYTDKYRREGRIILPVEGLVQKTGKLLHIGLGSSYGEPVIYADANLTEKEVKEYVLPHGMSQIEKREAKSLDPLYKENVGIREAYQLGRMERIGHALEGAAKNNLADYQKVFNGLQETELPDLEDVAWNIDRRAKSLMRVTTYEQGSHVRGLLDLVEALNDDELAFLLAHEYHQAQTGRLQKKGAMPKNVLSWRESRRQEGLADKGGLYLMHSAGFDPKAAVSALNTMEGFQSPNLLPNRRRKLLERVGLKTHPDVSKRRDYLERKPQPILWAKFTAGRNSLLALLEIRMFPGLFGLPPR